MSGKMKNCPSKTPLPPSWPTISKHQFVPLVTHQTGYVTNYKSYEITSQKAKVAWSRDLHHLVDRSLCSQSTLLYVRSFGLHGFFFVLNPSVLESANDLMVLVFCNMSRSQGFVLGTMSDRTALLWLLVFPFALSSLPRSRTKRNPNITSQPEKSDGRQKEVHTL